MIFKQAAHKFRVAFHAFTQTANFQPNSFFIRRRIIAGGLVAGLALMMLWLTPAGRAASTQAVRSFRAAFEHAYKNQAGKPERPAEISSTGVANVNLNHLATTAANASTALQTREKMYVSAKEYMAAQQKKAAELTTASQVRGSLFSQCNCGGALCSDRRCACTSRWNSGARL